MFLTYKNPIVCRSFYPWCYSACARFRFCFLEENNLSGNLFFFGLSLVPPSATERNSEGFCFVFRQRTVSSFCLVPYNNPADFTPNLYPINKVNIVETVKACQCPELKLWNFFKIHENASVNLRKEGCYGWLWVVEACWRGNAHTSQTTNTHQVDPQYVPSKLTHRFSSGRGVSPKQRWKQMSAEWST